MDHFIGVMVCYLMSTHRYLYYKNFLLPFFSCIWMQNANVFKIILFCIGYGADQRWNWALQCKKKDGKPISLHVSTFYIYIFQFSKWTNTLQDSHIYFYHEMFEMAFALSVKELLNFTIFWNKINDAWTRTHSMSSYNLHFNHYFDFCRCVSRYLLFNIWNKKIALFNDF